MDVFEAIGKVTVAIVLVGLGAALVVLGPSTVLAPLGELPAGEPANGSTVAPSNDAPVDLEVARETFRERLNDARAERGLSRVSADRELRAMGASHAANMARHAYVGHTQPDGTTVEDRFRARGLVARCGGIGENAARVPLFESVRTHYNESVLITSGEGLGNHLFRSWRSSSGHRALLFHRGVNRVGVGINITDGQAYAAFEAC